MRALTRSCWSLDEIDARYKEFVQLFRPLMRELSSGSELSDESSFIVRTLLIQEYRKVLLRDPWLPAALLPSNWHGAPAYQLCRNIYQIVHTPADSYLDAVFETADGPVPPPNPAFLQRFGGLDPKTNKEHAVNE